MIERTPLDLATGGPSKSESNVISSWVSRVAVLFSSLTWIVEYFGNGIGPLSKPRPPRPPPYLA